MGNSAAVDQNLFENRVRLRPTLDGVSSGQLTAHGRSTDRQGLDNRPATICLWTGIKPSPDPHWPVTGPSMRRQRLVNAPSTDKATDRQRTHTTCTPV